MPGMKHCKDCEPSQEIHSIAYLSVVFGWIDGPFFNLMDKIFTNTAEKIFDKASVPVLKSIVWLKLGRFTDSPSSDDSLRSRCFWEEAERRGIKMREFHWGPIKDVFLVEHGGKTISFQGLPRPSITASASISWMDNKGIMKNKFKKEGLPVAPGGVALTQSRALEIYNQITKPVITKPNIGSRSRHTLIHIDSPKKLIYGFKKAKKLSPLVVVEEELRGYLFRGTLIAGKLAGVVRRDQPQVTGDGVHTLEELMNTENKRPERQGPIFHKIVIDPDSQVELEREGVTMQDIPPKGKVITFSQKTSRGCGGTTTEVTDIVHPDNIAMLERVGAFLRDPLVGVDFIMEDITKPWKEEQHCGIIECNSLPFIDLHHYPLFGKPNNVASKLWDLVLPESKV